ncbi:WYL domain-containing protein [Pontibacter liquoris]|uniref:WYL domain-containing protein n=1 Tax=Pontibacter liquoris TaxID=2905677 RepID=UPI001FA7C16A|nr:WYL domain-containing protein [Pontibacter liquoris]
MYSYLLEELSNAIGARLLVAFDYDAESCIVEPHLLGCNKNGEDCLHAWQTSNTAETGIKGVWRCFLFSKIKNLKLLDDRFSHKRPGYDPYENTMTRIYYRI